jgi:hypothetical protein
MIKVNELYDLIKRHGLSFNFFGQPHDLVSPSFASELPAI